MSEARDQILNRIRQSLGRGELDDSQQSVLDKRITPSYEQLRVTGGMVDHFEKKLTAVHGEFQRVAEDGIVPAIADYLKANDYGTRLAVSPALQSLPWPKEWEIVFGATRGDELVGVTPCFTAVAETGSVVLLSSPESPTSLNFLPDHHIVLVRADQLVGYLEDVWPLLRGQGEPPRTVNFITGPSKTADIEQTIQYGAHGPRTIRVLFVAG